MREHIHISFWSEADKLWDSVDYKGVGPVLINILQKVRELRSFCDPLLVQTVHNLAQRYCDDQKFLEAETLFIELMDALRQKHTDSHPLVEDSRRALQHVQHLFLAKLADENEDKVPTLTSVGADGMPNKFLRTRIPRSKTA